MYNLKFNSLNVSSCKKQSPENKERKRGFAITIIASCMSIVACSDPSTGVNSNSLIALAKSTGITGDPTTGRTLPSITDPKAQLGKKLFFTKGLGGNVDSACVTCHHPTLGGGDNLSLPIGVGSETPDLLGVGRFHSSDPAVYEEDKGGEFDGGPTVPRNAPTTFNIALWDQVLFHDGRVESLGKEANENGASGAGIRTPDSAFGIADPDAGENLTAAQARFPVTSNEEMRGFEVGQTSRGAIRDLLALRLAGTWGDEFINAFGDAAITYPLIAEAIGEYERSQIFVDTPWKKFIEGDKDAISESAKRGAMKFFDTAENGGANCVSCHSGDFFTNEKFHVTAAPQIGRGKGNDNGTLKNDDFGRFRETG